MSNQLHTVFYTGVTDGLVKRVFQHRQKLVDGFTKKYNINKLLYFEEYQEVEISLNREKQVKDYRREKKFALINSMNPKWKDLWEEISK